MVGRTFSVKRLYMKTLRNIKILLHGDECSLIKIYQERLATIFNIEKILRIHRAYTMTMVGLMILDSSKTSVLLK
jgi:hypothetical protein